MPEKKEYTLLLGAMGKPLWTSHVHPMVKFYAKGPLSRNDCYYCVSEAVMVADLGIHERRCCSNPECMEKAAEEIWQFNCYEARKEGFGTDEKAMHEFLVAKGHESREILEELSQPEVRMRLLNLRPKADGKKDR